MDFDDKFIEVQKTFEAHAASVFSKIFLGILPMHRFHILGTKINLSFTLIFKSLFVFNWL